MQPALVKSDEIAAARMTRLHPRQIDRGFAEIGDCSSCCVNPRRSVQSAYPSH